MNPHQVLVFGGKIGANRSSDSKLYDFKLKKWSNGPINFTEGKSGFGFCLIQGTLFVAGGNNGSKVLNSFEGFELSTGRRKNLKPMNYARDELSLVNVGEFIYAIGGGGDDGSNLRSVERYDVNLDRWEQVENMLISRRAHSVVSLDGSIYVFGGFDGVKYLCSVER